MKTKYKSLWIAGGKREVQHDNEYIPLELPLCLMASDLIPSSLCLRASHTFARPSLTDASVTSREPPLLPRGPDLTPAHGAHHRALQFLFFKLPERPRIKQIKTEETAASFRKKKRATLDDRSLQPLSLFNNQLSSPLTNSTNPR